MMGGSRETGTGPLRTVTSAGIAVTAIALYAFVVLVAVPEGSPSPLARVVALAVIVFAAALALAIARWAPAWLRASAMLPLGFASIAVLGGVVAKRVVTGVSLGGTLGVVAGIAGIALVVQGWQRVLRPIARRWIRVSVAVVFSLLVAQFALLPAVFALDATNRPRPLGSGRVPADVGLAFEDVRITTPDGTTLAAWWVPSHNGAAVVLLPGAGSTRSAVIDHAALLARRGYGALLLDWRGHGRSAGRSMEFGWGFEADVRSAVSFVLDRPDVTDEVGILGLSLGAEIGLATAGQDPRITAVVAEGATARSWADARLEPDPHPVGYANEWLMFSLVAILAPEPEPLPLIEAIPLIRGPILLIAGEPTNEQKLAPLHAAAAPDLVTLWSVPDAPHTQALRTHRVAYEERVVSFFDAALLEAG